MTKLPCSFKTWLFRYCLAVAVGFLSENLPAQIAIDAIGNWNYSVPTADITEAGRNFGGTYASSTNQVQLDIYQTAWILNLFNFNWRVDVRKSDTDWNSNLKLFARRTGNGTPWWATGTISGGTSYIELTNSNKTFFSGSRSTLSIPVQFQITGVSVLLPAKTYSTTLIYTVTEL